MVTAHAPTLIQLAKSARENAHAPYSEYRVGAAVRCSNGQVYAGCNVENASLGATVCAERVTVFKAVSEGAKKIEEIAIITQSSPLGPPCGMCLQVLAEFMEDDAPVHVGNIQGEIRTFLFKELFPKAFRPSFLTPEPKKK